MKDRNKKWAFLTVGPATMWLCLLILVPLCYVIVISFLGMENRHFVMQFTFQNYKDAFSSLYLSVYINSFVIAFLNTLLCILIGYPYAWLIVRSSPVKRKILTNLMMIPLYTNSIVRLNGWKVILGKTGYLNAFLEKIGLIHTPITFMYTTGAVVFGMVYILLPFMVLPLVSSISGLDGRLLEASYDLGGKKARTFFHIALPLTKTGIFSGSIMVFIPSMAYFFISDVMGGAKHKLIGNTIQTQFQQAYNWPLGAAFSVILLVMTLVMVLIYKKSGGEGESLALM